MDVENPLIPHHTERDICAATYITPAGREYICIKPPHKPLYEFRPDKRQQQHYMVNRWPYREIENNTDSTI